MENQRIRNLLSQIYGLETGESILRDLRSIINKYRGEMPGPRGSGLNERDVILICYADQVQEPERAALTVLEEFCTSRVKDVVSGIHILPFFPWSSDDGFSVIDYRKVAPQYGDWSDVRRLGETFRLMFDAVINHASAESAWFQGYLRGEQTYDDYFIEEHGNPDLTAVVRPRALPLLTKFDTSRGSKALWTTFSADQIDLNYHNPRVLLEILDILLFYASQGAEFLRLDAIAYLWKEAGTPCINLPQTHWMVQLLRAVLDEIAPHVMLITETNVPNLENLSYFGDGSNEAQLVYNFPLPPLILHALQTGNASVLSNWASTLRLPSRNATFLNFLASHDGIGLNPVRGLLPESEIGALAQRIEANGGFVSNKSNANGTVSPYELNINYFDALNAVEQREDLPVQINRFLAAHAMLLAFMGVPAIYFHSLFGSRGWLEGVRQTGKNRSINRQKLLRLDLERELDEPHSLRAQVFHRLSHLLQIRAEQAGFSPQASQRVVESQSGVFVLLRQPAAMEQAVLCVQNVSRDRTEAQLDLSGTSLASAPVLRDLINGREVAGGKSLSLVLEPYESAWLTI
jgi:sucrose phosphorylase